MVKPFFISLLLYLAASIWIRVQSKVTEMEAPNEPIEISPIKAPSPSAKFCQVEPVYAELMELKIKVRNGHVSERGIVVGEANRCIKGT